MRVAASIFAMSLLITVAVPGSAAAAVHMPRSEAEWISMSPAQQAQVLQILWDRYQRGLANGTLHVSEVRGGPAPSATPDSVTATATYNCVVQWTTIPGEGDWVRGGGWTDASTTMSVIVAGYQLYSSPYEKGHLLRDGVVQNDWWDIDHDVSHAESYTPSTWTWWWETSTWTTRGWHTARQYNGVFLVGPDQYCTVSKVL